MNFNVQYVPVLLQPFKSSISNSRPLYIAATVWNMVRTANCQMSSFHICCGDVNGIGVISGDGRGGPPLFGVGKRTIHFISTHRAFQTKVTPLVNGLYFDNRFM